MISILFVTHTFFMLRKTNISTGDSNMPSLPVYLSLREGKAHLEQYHRYDGSTRVLKIAWTYTGALGFAIWAPE